MSATLLRSPTLGTATATSTRTASRSVWTGRILSGIAIAFLTFDTVIKLAGVKAAVDGTVLLGYKPEQLPIIGVIELVLLVLYLVPRTAPIGALLWTGYLGGAVATHFRLGNPLFSHILFPTYVAALLWGGLYLRDARVRAVLGKNR